MMGFTTALIEVSSDIGAIFQFLYFLCCVCFCVRVYPSLLLLFHEKLQIIVVWCVVLNDDGITQRMFAVEHRDGLDTTCHRLVASVISSQNSLHQRVVKFRSSANFARCLC